MKFNVLTEWRNFQAALIKELKGTLIAEFKKAWKDIPAKTEFYANVLLPRVAATLEYEFDYEHLRRDYVILNRDRVPVVFIESENNHQSASHEIEKLCAVSSPVRVLLLSCAWAETEREQYLPGWKERFATHHKYSGQDAVYMIVVGEWGRIKPGDDEILEYHIESFDIAGKEIGRERVILARTT